MADDKKKTFITKLHDMIEGGPEDIIKWTKDGKAFTIYNVDECAKKILPKYFKHTKFTSFVRNLNLYNFKKVTDQDEDKSSQAWTFAHSEFRKGLDKEQLGQFKRKLQQVPANITELAGRLVEMEEKIIVMQESYQMLWDEFVENRRVQSQHHELLLKLTRALTDAPTLEEPSPRKKRRSH
ncbi:HSF-type DNA-binding-domain-containing protein [Gorgonomyces haynaldii]|nr:HSF-type DNA-binding-domain-containing protein [Gorgonomyces haynaldii]